MGAGLKSVVITAAIANAWYFAEPISRYQFSDRLCQHRHTIGRPQIGFCTVRIATIKHGSAAKLFEQGSDVESVRRSHVARMRLKIRCKAIPCYGLGGAESELPFCVGTGFVFSLFFSCSISAFASSRAV